MQCFQLHLSAATRKTKGLSLRNAAPTLLHNSAQHYFVYRMALKGLKPKMGLHHANSQTRTRTLALPLSRSASMPSASMPSAAAEWAKPSRSAAALRRLACETILNLRSSVVQHPRGDAIPNPFPPPALHLRNLKHCVSPAFHSHMCCKRTNSLGETYNVKLCIGRPGAVLCCAMKSAKHYAHACFSFVLQYFMLKQRVPALATLRHHFCIIMFDHIYL
jgi:hypothetical protein